MDKYIRLALAMVKTRGDWSEGFYRVKDVLRHFLVSSPLDQEIYDEMMGHINDVDCMDGRIFRDTVHNYNWIFENILTPEQQKEYRVLIDKYYEEL